MSEERDKLKSELEESLQLLEGIQRELQETQTALVKMERETMDMADRLSDYELDEAKAKRLHEEMEETCEKLQAELRDLRSRKAECDAAVAARADLEERLGRTEDVKKGLKKKLESAYYELEETSRELSSLRREREENEGRVEEVKALTDALRRAKDDQQAEIDEAKAMAEDSFKVQMRLMEEKHADQSERLVKINL